MKIIRHRLQQDDRTPYPFQATANKGGKVEPEYLVIHYTAGGSAESSVRWFVNPASRASAHLVIGRDGSITQLVAFDTIVWHAGQSFWEGRQGLNRYSLGIELDNAGPLVRHGDRWRAWFGVEYDNAEVIETVHKHETAPRGWHIYPPQQIEVALEVAGLLVRRYGLHDVVGHEDIAPGRKKDPGPAFPLESFRSRVLGRADNAYVEYETTTTLNIRTGPGTQHAPLPGSPLSQGTRVVVVAEQGVWREVDVLQPVNDINDMHGWLHGRYLARAPQTT